MTRSKAFFWHLIGSSTIALLAILVVFHLWYPAPLHNALGVTQVFMLVLMVDVVLGPVLTLVIYRVGKKALVFDLSLIIFLQITALGYGLFTVAEGRPAWVVFNVDRFDLVQAMEIDKRKLEDAREEYRVLPWSGPRWVGAAVPTDPNERQDLIFESVFGGSDITQRPNLYRELREMENAVRKRAQPLEKLYEFNDSAVVRKALLAWPEATAWLPLMARVKPMVVLLKENSSEALAIVALDPWN